MTKSSELAEGSTIDVSAENGRFDQVSIALHWLTVLLIIVQFSSVWLLETVDEKSSFATLLLHMHRNSGVLVWVIGLARLVWRHNFAYLPPFPRSMPKLQQTIAKANEYGIYLLLFLQPITGLDRVLLRGHPFDLLFWEVPALLEPNDSIRILFVEAHETGAKVLLALIGLHAGAALLHRLILRDDVLQRMLPWVSRSVHEADAKQAARPAE